ncbi:RtcB family protein [bacterium]|nr:RtcB family protein [bacterium]
MAKIKKIAAYTWEIQREGKMRVPARFFAKESMLSAIQQDNALIQLMNVAQLPGIINYAFAMPDIHLGYGFPIGGVAAFGLKNGVISPGGVGYDINCGVRLMRTQLSKADVLPKIEAIVKSLFAHIPSGVGSAGSIRLNATDEKQVLKKGALWAVEQGWGSESDLQFIEENGQMPGADPIAISERALQRGRPQLGTLGSGNHFCEIEYVEKIYDAPAAAAFGLFPDQIVISLHTGSRGFGHQVCDDQLHKMLRAAQHYGIDLPDRQLCCAPIESPEGREYLAAMACAANYAFANRQIIYGWIRTALAEALKLSLNEIRLETVYEVAHNIAKFENHRVNGVLQKVCVHRKGATRAFGPGHADVPEKYRAIGQPVLIPGDMGRYSYVLAGTEKAMTETFGSICHGAGRLMSRNQAKKAARGRDLFMEMKDRGVFVISNGRGTMAEEMPAAYKDVSDVVDAVDGAGIARKVARLRPLGCIKG